MQQDLNQRLILNIPEAYMSIYKEIIDSMAANARQMMNE